MFAQGVDNRKWPDGGGVPSRPRLARVAVKVGVVGGGRESRIRGQRADDRLAPPPVRFSTDGVKKGL